LLVQGVEVPCEDNGIQVSYLEGEEIEADEGKIERGHMEKR